MIVSLLTILACTDEINSKTVASEFNVQNNLDTAGQDTAQVEDDTDLQDTAAEDSCEPVVYDPNPFITSVASYEPGEGAGFGQESFPDIVFGPPLGGGEGRGSMDVLSLGKSGTIVLDFDLTIIDGPGPDLVVFENPFFGWSELATISVSSDGINWVSWPCDPTDSINNYLGCAGYIPVLTHPDNCIDATDPTISGGDLYDLADIGLQEAVYVRIQDSGLFGDGFDLDSIGIIHGVAE